jgi:hypothetical protein
MFKILMDSTDCSITNNSTVAAHTGSVLVENRAVQAGNLLDWRFYGAIVPIPAGVHTLTLCTTGGDLNVDYLKFKVSTQYSDRILCEVYSQYSALYCCCSSKYTLVAVRC